MVTFLFFSTQSSEAYSESPWVYSGYSSDELSEYEYADPYEGEGPYSSTPSPACDGGEHKICVPPAWGERIPSPTVSYRCILCHQDGCHHAVRCIQCLNAPGCCVCIWGYMRSRYNSGCPLYRAGDPCGENPLGQSQRRCIPMRREELTSHLQESQRKKRRRRTFMWNWKRKRQRAGRGTTTAEYSSERD